MTLTPKKSHKAPIKRKCKKELCQSVHSPKTLTNFGTFHISQMDLTSDKINKRIEKTIILPQNCPFDGQAQLNRSLLFRVTSQCQGRLSIYMKIDDHCAWTSRDCKITYRCVVGGTISETSGEIEDIDVEILFCTFKGQANAADFRVYGKSNSFSIILDQESIINKKSVNKWLSNNDERNCRFVAATESKEDTDKWCNWTNDYYKSFLEWSKFGELN